MKIRLNGKRFGEILAMLKAAVDTKSSMPILGSVMVMAENGRVRFRATDLSTEVLLAMPAVVLEAGDLLMSPHKVAKALGTWKGDVTLYSAESLMGAPPKMSLEIDGMVSEFEELPAADFPDGMKVGGSVLFEMPQSQWKLGMQRVAYAMSRDKTRESLKCLHLHGHTSMGLVFEATDGHRCVRWVSGVDSPEMGAGMGPLKAMLPGPGVVAIQRLLSGYTGPFEYLHPTPGMLAAVVDVPTGSRVSMRRTDAEFPHLDHVIPQDWGMGMAVDAEVLLGAMKRFDDGVKLTLEEGAETVLLESNDTTGKRSMRVAVRSITRGTMPKEEPKEAHPPDDAPKEEQPKETTYKVSMVARYMKEAMEAMGKDVVTIGVRGELDPILLIGSDCIAVVMPMRP